MDKKSKTEIDSLKLKIQELEKEKSLKSDDFKKNFNHDYGVSKKIRLILNY
jgi:hypothetical protein